MPRIRRKTSNRQSINDRHKIQRKVREGRKKKAKQAKKNPQWKSKHKKDPGIPNDFPYKDQILAEVAEQRRIAAEEKLKRKEEKRLARNQQDKGGSEKLDDKNEDRDETFNSKNLDVGSEAIASLSAKLIDPKLVTKEKQAAQMEDNGEEEDVPILVNRNLPTLKTVLDASDVLLQILDARDPLPFRSLYLEKAMQGKKVLLVLNKIDLCPREGLTSWLSFLRREYPTFLFRSATAFLPGALEATAPAQSKGKGRTPLPKGDALGSEAILSQLSKWAREKGQSPLTVAVTGLTNAGKSSFLNSLLCKASLPVYSLSTSSQGRTTTLLPQDITIVTDETPIRFIDTPGIAWSTDPPEGEVLPIEQLQARDILLRSRGRIDRLKDPSSALSHIVERANVEDLMLMYSLPAFSKRDSAAFLAGVARSNHLVKKRGVLDLTGASKIVLRDWNTGKFARYTLPPAVDGGVAVSPLTDTDETILTHIRTRREIRKQGGLVKMVTLSVDKRAVYLESPWEAELEGREENDEMIDQVMNVAEEVAESESGGDGEEEETERNEDEENVAGEEASDEGLTPPTAFTHKRKRAASFTSAQPAKKVAFAHRKQKKPAQSLGKIREESPKSILKKSTTITKTKSPGNAKKPPGKVANVAMTLKKRANGTDDPNAYDFTNFF